jgi:hypothetical protein
LLGPASRIALCLAWSLGACSFIFDKQEAGDAGPSGGDASGDATATTCAEAKPVIEAIEVNDLSCGETQIDFPLVTVTSDAGPCPVAALRWKMSKRPADGGEAVELFNQEGAPDARMTPGARILGGSFQEPTFNVANYHGPTLLSVSLTSGGGYNQIFQDTLPVANENLVFRGSVLSGGGHLLTVSFFDGQGVNGTPVLGMSALCLGPEGETCKAPTELTTFIHPFSTMMLNDTPRLRFHIVTSGVYYFDNLSLVRASDSSNLVVDSSFDNPSPDAWRIMCPNGNCPATTVPIPSNIAEYGTYTLDLVAIGTNGLESESSQFVYLHSQCPPM